MPKNGNGFYENLFRAPSSTKAGADELIKRSQLIRERFSKRDEILDAVEDFYYKTGVFKRTDEDIYDVYVNDAQTAADLIADLLSAQEVSITVPAHSESSKSKRAANDIERWLSAWFTNVQREEDIRFVHELALDVVLRGAAATRVIMLDERIPKKGEQSFIMRDFPLIMEVRDFRNIYPVFKRTRLVEVFECYEATVADIRIDWPGFNVPKEWNDTDQVQLWEWWSDKKKAFWVSGNPYGSDKGDENNVVWLMKPVSHGYGTLPYAIRFMRPQSKKRNEPERMAPSLLQSWAGAIEAMNKIESAKFTAAMSYINSAWAVYSENPDFELDLTHGAINYLRPDEKVEPIIKGNMPIDLNMISSEWSSRFQRASIPLALYGENIGPNMAGYAISLLNESGRRILIPITSSISSVLSDAFGIALSILEHLLGPTLEANGYEPTIFVTQEGKDKNKIMRGVKLDWRDVAKNYMVEVKLGDPMPQDKERNVNMAMALRQPDANGKPLLSDESIRTDILGVQDNLQEVTRIYREMLMTEAAQLIAQEQAVEAGVIPADESAPPEEMDMPQEGDMPMEPEDMAMEEQPDPIVVQLMKEVSDIKQTLEQLMGAVSGPPQPMPIPGAGPMPMAPGPGPGPEPGLESLPMPMPGGPNEEELAPGGLPPELP